PDASLGEVLGRVRAIGEPATSPLVAPVPDLAAVALALAHGGAARTAAWAAIGRLLGGPPRPHENAWLRVVAGHDPGAVSALATAVAPFRATPLGPYLMPPSRIAAMQA